MKLSKVLLSSAVAAALVFGFAGCASDEDANNMLKGYSISLTNNGELTNDGKEKTDNNEYISYARSWNVTESKHVSADATIKIERKTLSTQVGLDKKAKEGSYTTTNGTNNAAYIFGLTEGKIENGAEKGNKTYSFYLLGFRLFNATPQYFLSYYTGVQSKYCNTDADDFDTDDLTNTAYEYIAVSAWTPMPENSYNLTEDALTVYIDLAAVANNEEVTKNNYSKLKGTINGYKVTLKPSKEDNGISKTVTAKDFKAQTYNKDKNGNRKIAPSLTEFNIDQGDIGFYAMVGKNKTLVASLEFDNDSFVRSITVAPTDDFGNEIDLNGEVLKNF